MSGQARVTWAMLVLCGGLAAAASARAEGRSAEQILADLKKVELPQLNPAQRGDQAAVRDYIEKRQEAMGRRAELIGELYQADPKNGQLGTLMPERWMDLMSTDVAQADKVLAEIDDVAAKTADDAVKTEGAYIKAQIKMFQSRGNLTAALPAIEEFARRAPKDPRAAQLLYAAAMRAQPEEKAKLEDRLLEAFPDSQYSQMIAGDRRRREAIGKPFELEFKDAISGKAISMKDLKGQVVVIDFWATWCGPCVAELPHMKELYAKYHDQGVEFVGVSLDAPEDEGGLTALKDFVKEREISWPQYYQGKGWQSEFSGSWGINAIPAVFVVAPDGTLSSVEARGKLDEMIPELLKSKAEKPAAVQP